MKLASWSQYKSLSSSNGVCTRELLKGEKTKINQKSSERKQKRCYQTIDILSTNPKYSSICMGSCSRATIEFSGSLVPMASEPQNIDASHGV